MTHTHSSVHAGRPEYFRALDGFRGVLAIFVAIYHTFWFSNINSTTFFNNGPVIIDLFFVFSGFLLYRLYHNKLNTADEAGTFLKRRFARLYPIHIFMLAVFILFSLARIMAHNAGISVQEAGEVLPFEAGAPESIWAVISHLTMTHSMGMTEMLTFNAPAWTISVEFFAYFVFLLMFLRIPPTKGWHFGLLALAVAVIYAGLSRVKPDMNITYDLGFWRCLAGFYTGVVTCWVYGAIKPLSENIMKSKSVATLLEVIVLSAFVGFVIYMPGKLQFFVAPFAFMFVLVFAFDRGLISKVMSNKVFLYLAKISYSVYMIHMIFAIVFNIAAEKVFSGFIGEGLWGGDIYMLAYLTVVIVCSHLTWTFIERPGQKFIQGIQFKTLFSKREKADLIVKS